MSLCVQLYAIIYWEKHNFCHLSLYTAVSSHCMLFWCILKHVFLYFIAVMRVGGKIRVY